MEPTARRHDALPIQGYLKTRALVCATFLLLLSCSAEAPPADVNEDIDLKQSGAPLEPNVGGSHAVGVESRDAMDTQTERAPYTDSSGLRWTVSTNRHGAVLTSESGQKLYLGGSCDAFSPEHGKGRWEWANGGFLVVFSNEEVGFPRQEVEADRDGNCRS